MTLAHWVIAGYADNRERSPWKRAPMTESQVRAGGESDEQRAYWDGFNSGVMDAMSAAIAAGRNALGIVPRGKAEQAAMWREVEKIRKEPVRP